ENGVLRQVAEPEDIAMKGDGTGVHLPSPSYWPLVLALGLPFIGYGLIFHLSIAAIGGIPLGAGVVGWVLEPSDDPDLPPHDHGDDQPVAEGGTDAAEADAPAATPDEEEVPAS